MTRKIALLTILFCLAGCTDATWQGGIGSLGSKFKVTLYSGGQIVATWTSTGKVENEHQSDGYKFVDEKSGKLIRVTGTIIVAQE